MTGKLNFTIINNEVEFSREILADNLQIIGFSTVIFSLLFRLMRNCSVMNHTTHKSSVLVGTGRCTRPSIRSTIMYVDLIEEMS